MSQFEQWLIKGERIRNVSQRLQVSSKSVMYKYVVNNFGKLYKYPVASTYLLYKYENCNWVLKAYLKARYSGTHLWSQD